jgi:hypothetical protein
MRDLYKRRNRLAGWIKRINDDVDEPNRTDVLNSSNICKIDKGA